MCERTTAEYEEELCPTKEEKERQHQRLDAVFKTHGVVSSDIQQPIHIKEEEEEPHPPHIKEEGELWTTQEGECLLGQEEADLTKFPLTGVSVKTEEHEDKPPESSQLHSFNQDAQQPAHIKKEEEEPQHPHIKEEEEECRTTQEGECLLGQEEADLTKFPLTVVSVKTEEHEDKPPESSQLHHSPDVQQLIGRQEGRPLLLQRGSSTLEQEASQSSHVKEEGEELWTTQEEECLLGQEEADLTKFPLTVVSVKTEDHEDKPPESAQLHHSPVFSITEAVKEAVWSYLPGLPDDLLTIILHEAGVKCMEDLRLVEEKDLLKYLQPTQCRKLLEGLKQGFFPLHLQPVSPRTPTFSSTLSHSSGSLSSSSSLAGPCRPWHADFRVDWDQMPPAIRSAVENERRPSAQDRKAMVTMVVDQMMRHDRNPTRAMCHSVIRGIVRSFPKSFADVGRHGELVGDGCHSLLQQIKTRVEYMNRNNTLARRRRQKRQRAGVSAEARTFARRPTDQYGCVRWCPVELPEGETEDTLDAVKRLLRDIHSAEGMSAAERAAPLMEKTYVILRRYLNGTPAPTMADVKEEWPFLFSLRGFYSHFYLLTDIRILSKLQEALCHKGSTLLRFCQQYHHQGVREVLARFQPETCDKTACVLLLLLAYFTEPTAAIMLQTDMCTTAADVQAMVELPSTPCLVVQGDVLKPSAWMLCVDRRVVMGPHSNFLHGVASVFASYYIFNLEYPVDGSCTLEFIQRCFLGINPEKGAKSQKRRAGNMNAQISSLFRKLLDFEWSA
ncbi:uncharacterized protein si:dkey-15h8.17 isoform X2 [Entelurus aequoreus]|uniref:uncharacterized protein si:dkey-15h8.17 isoform X2 n=1 Tax=Entelurus aequoreus TaxID=161455 RepID=UPI002B1E2E4C|nr:uncharacterized protein si:dkey-15h8.17 isoform X2 [Entelurus aequoreus]